MKHRITAMVLALILCATALMFSPHLFFHDDYDDHPTVCLACKALARKTRVLACLAVFAACVGLPAFPGRHLLYTLWERWFVSDRTPIRLKVKMQD